MVVLIKLYLKVSLSQYFHLVRIELQQPAKSKVLNKMATDVLPNQKR